MFAMDCKIGFIGVGNMASAMIMGLTDSKKIAFDHIFLYDVIPDKMSSFEKKGAHTVKQIDELVEKCDCIVLAVKPQIYDDILAYLATANVSKRILYISIAAGINTDKISNILGGVPVVRALPNTPMLIGKGVTALCKNNQVTEEEFAFVCSVFETAGTTIKIDETEMNKIISVTSSSPAYVFMFIKAICDGAEFQGLKLEDVRKTVCDMVCGAAQLLASSEQTPDELISMVCSKGGTTERAIDELKKRGFSDAIVSAMTKCTERADELGKK